MRRERGTSWPDQVANAIAAELEVAQPEKVGERLVPTLRQGRRITPVPEATSQPPGVTEEIVAAGIASMIARRIAAGNRDSLMQLHPDLVEFALTPYLGPGAAAEAARRAAATTT